jgi:hypothetical protein
MRAMSLARSVYFSDYCPYIYVKHSGSVSRAQNAERLYFYMIGDLYVSLSYKKFANSLKDEELKNYIVKWSNSIILNLLYTLKRNNNPIINQAFINKMLFDLFGHKVFPVKGPLMTWKQYIISLYINLYFKIKYYDNTK